MDRAVAIILSVSAGLWWSVGRMVDRVTSGRSRSATKRVVSAAKNSVTRHRVPPAEPSGAVPDRPAVVPAPGVVVRRAHTDDAVAGLVFEAASDAYRVVAGSELRARAAIEQLWRMPGHSASFEHALVAELDGKVVGVLIGYPARERYRLHFSLLRRGLRYVSVRRWPLVLMALGLLVAATPRPPRRSYYVGTIAIARGARRHGVASTLGYHAELLAQHRGCPVIVAHTGSRHRPARMALERYGLRTAKERRWGYALYVKDVSVPG
jgi:GNAT superfamily N-acetyltransferase